VLDAQYFGVAQRRRRVFVVGHLGDWRPTAEVLFESESLSRNTKSSRKKREETSRSFIPSIASTLQTTCNDYSRADGFNMIVKPVSFDERNIRSFTNSNFKTFPTLAATDYKGAKAICYENHPSDSRVREMGDVCQTVTSSWGTGGGNVPFVQNVAIPYDLYQITSPLNGQRRENGDPCHTLARDNAAHASIVTNNPIAWDAELNANENKMGTLLRGGQGGRTDGVMMANMAVRRLTPVECERLQGFPDGYTDIKPNGKETPDGHRYKALGNSMAVPVMRWIGERINSYETMRSKAAVQVETGLGIAEV
jgi:DNA (cytosine-5)-methyltransferase 1